MFRTMRATGAYGIPASLENWKIGKDFYSLDHLCYFSIRDYEALRRDGIIQIDFMGRDGRVFSVKVD